MTEVPRQAAGLLRQAGRGKPSSSPVEPGRYLGTTGHITPQRALYAEEEIESNDMLMVVSRTYYYTGHTENCPCFIANSDIAQLKRLRLRGFLRLPFRRRHAPDSPTTRMEIECRTLLSHDRLQNPGADPRQKVLARLFYEVEKDYLDVKSKISASKQIRETRISAPPGGNSLPCRDIAIKRPRARAVEAVFVDRCLFGDRPQRATCSLLYTALTRHR